MSRLGKTPISIPKPVQVRLDAEKILKVKGPKGELDWTVPEGIKIVVSPEKIEVQLVQEKLKSYHGMARSVIQCLVDGVVKGFSKTLTLVGVGFRAQVTGQKLELKVGFSHPVVFDIPKGLTVTVEKGVEILISGCDKQLVGQFAADVRSIKEPEPYKGKGIRYVGEYVRKKAGKAAAKAAKTA